MGRTKKNAGGFFLVWRSFRESPLWPANTRSKYAPFEALLDLWARAEYEDGRQDDRGEVVVLLKGDQIACERYLAERWKWSRGKVRVFLRKAQSRGEIELKRDHRRTVLTLCNFPYWQNPRTTKRPTDRTTAEPKGKEGKETKEGRRQSGDWSGREKKAARNVLDRYRREDADRD